MNLVFGEFLDNDEALARLEELGGLIAVSRRQPPLLREEVIAALDAFSKSLSPDSELPLLEGMGLSREKALYELEYARTATSREYLEERIRRELGGDPAPFVPFGETGPIKQKRLPLGVIMHIAAGNVDALPVYSVIEGLLTGNISILKLPTGDGGLSAAILGRLIELEPKLRHYVCVFDFPSSDTASMEKMAAVSDAVVVWGGDEAIRAVRRLASPDTRIIEWGHKLSFAYVSGEADEEALRGVAFNICDTEQLYCSSCQGIYVDADDFGEVCRFAERFADILQEVSLTMPSAGGTAVEAQKTLELYTEELEASSDEKHIFRRRGCSVIAYRDNRLAPSYMFRNCFVRPLPRGEILDRLCGYKNLLQTVALICPDADRPELEELFFKTGAVRITSGRRMSRNYCGSPHDGEFALARYMKTVSVEY